jgi:hypothetical protein
MGYSPGRAKTIPVPMVNVKRSSTVIGRLAGTVLSNGASILVSILRPASSGSNLSTGSSMRTLPSSTRIMVAAAVTGLVIEEIRKIPSRVIEGPPYERAPMTSTCVSAARLTRATRPGTFLRRRVRRRLSSSPRGGPTVHLTARTMGGASHPSFSNIARACRRLVTFSPPSSPSHLSSSTANITVWSSDRQTCPWPLRFPFGSTPGRNASVSAK